MAASSLSLGLSKRNETLRTAVIFLTPAVLFLAVFLFYPILNSAALSLTAWNGAEDIKKFIGFANWKSLAHDKRFLLAFVNNLKIVVFSIGIQLPAGMCLAILLHYVQSRVSGVFKSLLFLPMLMSSVAIGFLFRYIYDPEFGLFLPILKAAGFKEVDILGNPKIAVYSVVFVICWQFIPFYMVYFLAGLNTLSKEVHESAVMDGAGEGVYIFRFALPMMRGIIYNAAVMALVGALKYFDLVYVMTEGGPSGSTELMATYMYKNAFVIMKMGYGSTIATAMLIIISVVSLVTIGLLRRNMEDAQ